jgi:hypothetical protein
VSLTCNAWVEPEPDALVRLSPSVELVETALDPVVLAETGQEAPASTCLLVFPDASGQVVLIPVDRAAAAGLPLEATGWSDVRLPPAVRDELLRLGALRLQRYALTDPTG